MITRAKNWILRPYLDSAHLIEEESTILVTDRFCVLTSDINHNPLEWRLTIDSSKLSLKAVLLHSGNTLPSQWQHPTFTVAKPYLHSGNTIPSQWQNPTFTVATPYLHSGNTLPSQWQHPTFTVATPYLLLLLDIQWIIRSHMRTRRFWWKPLITTNSNGKSVVT